MEKSADAFRTISEVADLLETPAHVLRFWESRFPQIKPVKRAGGRRYYRPADVALLTGIKRLLHDEGMTIRGVQKILREQGVRHVAGLTEEPTAEEEALEAAMLADLGDDDDTPPRSQSEVEAEQAAALQAALDVPPASVVVPFPGWGDAASAPTLDPAFVEVAEPAPMAIDVEPEPYEPAVVASFPSAPGATPAEVAAERAAPADPDPAPAPLPEDILPVAVEPGPRGPALSLTSVSGGARAAGTPVAPVESAVPAAAPPAAPEPPLPNAVAPEPAAPDSAAPVSNDTPEEAQPVPLPNRLRALPRTALASRQDRARAALARLTDLRARLANPGQPPRMP